MTSRNSSRVLTNPYAYLKKKPAKGGVPREQAQGKAELVVMTADLPRQKAEATEPTTRTVADPAERLAIDPAAMPAAEPVVMSIAEMKAEVTAGSVTDLAAMPGVEAKAESAADPVTVPMADPAAIPAAEAKAEPVADPVAILATEAMEAPAVNPATMPMTEARSNARAVLTPRAGGQLSKRNDS
jgi:hypothetical protein